MSQDNCLEEINFDSINNEIRTENIARGIKDEYPNLYMKNENRKEDTYIYSQDMYKSLENMAFNADNRAFRMLSSHRKIIGSFIILSKRIIRKLLKWYIEPVCNQQSDFNHNTVACVKGVSTNIKEMVSEVELLKQDWTAFQDQEQTAGAKKENQLNDLQNVVEIQKIKLSDLQNEINLQEKQLNDLKNVIVIYEKNRTSSIEAQIKMSNSLMDTFSKMNQLIENHSMNDLSQIAEQVFEQLKNDKYDIYSIIEKKPKYQFGRILSSSQSGEDLIISYVLDSLKIPFHQCEYLDIGANHPKFMSNTYFFYCFGARGVLVEANPSLIPALKEMRVGDIVLNKCIAAKTGEIKDFYIVNGDGLSTMDPLRAEHMIEKNASLKIDHVKKIETISVQEIFANYFEKDPILVSLDIEGYELEILKTMDLKKNRPLLIIVETIPYVNGLAVGTKNMEIIDFMESADYIEYAFTGINSIFLDKKVHI